MNRFLIILLWILFFHFTTSCENDNSIIEDSEEWFNVDYIENQSYVDNGELTTKNLKILVICNSFGIDITENLPDVFKLNNLSGVTILRAYKGFSGIKEHLNGLRQNVAIYEKVSICRNNSWEYLPSIPLKEILSLEQWNVIVLNDISTNYINPQTQYSEITSFIKSINDNLGYIPKYVWLSSWAYSDGYNVRNFDVYGNSEKVMFNHIQSTLYNELLPSNLFWKIVPCGIAVQNARNSTMNNPPLRLTRDGYHADLGAGRYLLSYLFFETLIFPISDLEDIKYMDWENGNFESNEKNKYILNDIIKNAISHPFSLKQHN